MSSVRTPVTGSDCLVSRWPEGQREVTRPPAWGEEERLLRGWEPLLRRLARRCGRRAEQEDLEQVARIALWQAAHRFDPARGCSFMSFAMPTIQGALRRHLRDRSGTVRVPRRWWELRPRLQQQAEAAAQELGREPTMPELAERLGVTQEEVAGALGARDLAYPASLDEPRATPGIEDTEPLSATLGAMDPQLEAVELRVTVREAVARLPQRLRRVIEQRYFAGLSQLAVGQRLGLSQVHVSRLERWALALLQAELHQIREPAPRRGEPAPPADNLEAILMETPPSLIPS